MAETKKGFWTLGRIIQVGIGIFALVLIAVNLESTQVDLIFGSFTLPLALVLAIFFGLGFFACWINQRGDKK